MNGLETADKLTVERLISIACGGAYPGEGEGPCWGEKGYTFQSPWSTPWPEVTAPGTPASDYGAWYTKDSGGASMPFFKSDDGTEYNLSTASAGSVNLNDLGDLTITSADSGDFIRYSGSAWVDVGIAQIITDLALDDIVAGSGIGVTDGADTIIGGNVTVAIGALTGDHDFGAHKITAEQVAADIADGTAPLIVASTTVVTNLNSDYLDGQHHSDLQSEFSPIAGSASILTVGTIGTGAWEGTVIDSAYIDQSLGVASVTANGTVQAEHLYSTDDLVVDGLATVGETLKVGNTVIDPDSHNNTVQFGTIADGGGWSGIGIGMHEGTGAGDTASIVLTSNVLYFGLGDGSADDSLTGYMNLTNAGLLSLPTAGSGAGILMGPDFHIYRSAANVGYTPDSFQVNANFSVGVAPSSLYEGYFYRASAGDAQLRVTNPTDGVGSNAQISVESATSVVTLYAFPANYTGIAALADKGGFYGPASAAALFLWKSGNAPIEFYTNSTLRTEIQGDGTLWQKVGFHLDGDFDHDGTNFGACAKAPQAQQAFIADATDAAETMALVNNLKNLIAVGFGFMAAS